MRKALSILFALFLLAPAADSATKRSSTAKKPATTAKAKTGVRKATSKSSVKRRGTKRSTSRARARRSGPPRQTAPTPERYMEIQQALASKGYFDGPIDGKWSADCVQALKRFQADQSLKPDGKLGALSLIALGLGPKREPLPPQFESKPEPTETPN